MLDALGLLDTTSLCPTIQRSLIRRWTRIAFNFSNLAVNPSELPASQGTSGERGASSHSRASQFACATPMAVNFTWVRFHTPALPVSGDGKRTGLIGLTESLNLRSSPVEVGATIAAHAASWPIRNLPMSRIATADTYHCTPRKAPSRNSPQTATAIPTQIALTMTK